MERGSMLLLLLWNVKSPRACPWRLRPPAFADKMKSGEANSPPRCYYSRQRPTLPHRYQCSTIGPGGLNYRVRNGNGCGPSGIAARNINDVEGQGWLRHKPLGPRPSTLTLGPSTSHLPPHPTLSPQRGEGDEKSPLQALYSYP